MVLKTSPQAGEVWLDAAAFRSKRTIRELLIRDVGDDSASAIALSGSSPGPEGVPLKYFGTDLVWQGWWSEGYKRLPTLRVPFDEHPFAGRDWAKRTQTLTGSATVQHSLISSLSPSRVTCFDREQQLTDPGVGVDTIVSHIGAGWFYLRFDYEREYVKKGLNSPDGLKSLFFQKQKGRWYLVRTLFTD